MLIVRNLNGDWAEHILLVKSSYLSFSSLIRPALKGGFDSLHIVEIAHSFTIFVNSLAILLCVIFYLSPGLNC